MSSDMSEIARIFERQRDYRHHIKASSTEVRREKLAALRAII